jgi:hypothetical protein
MTHEQITFDKEAVVLWIEDSLVDVFAGEPPDAVPGVPKREVMISERSPSSRRGIQAPDFRA